MKKRWVVLFLTPCLAWAQFPANPSQENEEEAFAFLEQKKEEVASAPVSEEKSLNFCPQCGESLKTYQEKTAQVKSMKALPKEVAESSNIAEAPRSEKKKGGGSLRKVAPHTATQYSDRPRVTHRKPQGTSESVAEKQAPSYEAEAPQMTPQAKKKSPAAVAPKTTPQATPGRPKREQLKPAQKNVVQSAPKEVSSIEEGQPKKERLKSAGAEQRKKRACAYKKREAQKQQFEESISSRKE